MRVITVAAILLLIAIYFILTVAAEVFVDDYIRPRSLFATLLEGTILSGVAALAINIDVSD